MAMMILTRAFSLEKRLSYFAGAVESLSAARGRETRPPIGTICAEPVLKGCEKVYLCVNVRSCSVEELRFCASSWMAGCRMTNTFSHVAKEDRQQP